MSFTVNHVVTFGLLPDVAARLQKLEGTMGIAIDKINEISEHVTALEARDAVHTTALTDLKTQLDGLKAQVAAGDDPAAVTAAVDALVARIDKVEADLPAPPANPPA